MICSRKKMLSLKKMFFLHLFQSHFSIKKGAAALGIGTESVICIKADERLLFYTFYKWYRIQQQNKHLAVFKNPPTLMNLCHLTWLWLCFYSGKLIPADLERRILEAKQKVLWSYMVSSRAGHVWSGQTGKKKKKTSLTLCLLFVFLQGFVPFFVSATAGTTVYGAFDPLIAISDICRKYNIWMHVDVSDTHTHTHPSKGKIKR